MKEYEEWRLLQDFNTYDHDELKFEFSEVLLEEEQRFLEYYDGEEDFENILLLKRDLEFLNKIDKLNNPPLQPKKRRKLSSPCISPPRQQFNTFLAAVPMRKREAGNEVCRSYSSDSMESCPEGRMHKTLLISELLTPCKDHSTETLDWVLSIDVQAAI